MNDGLRPCLQYNLNQINLRGDSEILQSRANLYVNVESDRVQILVVSCLNRICSNLDFVFKSVFKCFLFVHSDMIVFLFLD